MSEHNDLRRSLAAFEQNSTLIAVIEMSLSSWLVGGIVPGLDRHPLKKMGPDQEALLRLLQRWREEAFKAGRMISRIVIAYETGRDGFWLARWLRSTMLRPTLFTPRASLFHANIGGRRPIGSTPNS